MEQLLNTFTRKSMYNVTYNDNTLSLTNECKMKKIGISLNVLPLPGIL